MQMCNFCLDRPAVNKNLICVDACFMMALDAGHMDKLKARYGEIRVAAGFSYPEQANPSVIFKPENEDWVNKVGLFIKFKEAS